MSGTTIGRVELPLSIEAGSGQDVTVGLYANSGGVPTGSVISQVTIPSEFLINTQNNSIFPEQTTAVMGSAVVISGNQPGFPQNTFDFTAQAITPTLMVVVGGWDNVSAATNQVSVVFPPSSESQLASVQSSQAYPISLYGACGTAVSDSVFFAGGSTAGATVQTASFGATLAANGILGSWIAQPDLPIALAYSSAAGISRTTNGTTNNTMYVIGGVTSIGGNPVSNVYAGTITNGSIQDPWVAVNSLPVGTALAAIAEINGWLVLIGGALSGGGYSSNVFAAKINDDTTLQPWIPWPSLPAPVQRTGAVVIGNSILLTGGATTGNVFTSNSYVLPVGTNGPSDHWILQDSVIDSTSGAVTTNGNFLYYYLGGLTAAIGQTGNISVPMAATGLTNGATYHIVIQGIGGILSVDDCKVAINLGTPTANFRVVGTSPWIAGPANNGVPLQIYTGNTGRIYHVIEDVVSGVSTEWKWLIYNGRAEVQGVGEYLSQMRSFRTITYDGSGLPTLSS